MQLHLSRILSIVLVFATILTECGCASYVSASMPDTTGSSSDDHHECKVETGSKVRGDLKDGKKFSGVVARVSPEELVVKTNGEIGAPRQKIPVGEIENLEVQVTPHPSDRVLSVAFFGIFASVVITWAYLVKVYN